MKFPSLKLTFDHVEDIRRLPGSWTLPEFRKLLTVLDMENVESYPEGEVEEMAIMALQDLEAEEAMQVVLTHFTGQRFTPGQIRNLSEELKESDAWEEYPEMKDQRALYICVDPLNLAFPYAYPEPSAADVGLSMMASGLDQAHAKHPLDAATVLRAIGGCQDEDSILNRFFPDQVAGAAFPEAESVIWGMETPVVEPNLIKVRFHGSGYWFRGLDDDDQATCTLDWP